MKTFPKYLIVQITNFTLSGWIPKKLLCDVQLGDLSDVSWEALKAPAIPEGVPVSSGAEQQGEEALPAVDEMALANLLSMGFSENRCKRALMETGNNLDNAINHIMSTLDDMTQEEPIVAKKKAGYGLIY